MGRSPDASGQHYTGRTGMGATRKTPAGADLPSEVRSAQGRTSVRCPEILGSSSAGPQWGSGRSPRDLRAPVGMAIDHHGRPRRAFHGAAPYPLQRLDRLYARWARLTGRGVGRVLPVACVSGLGGARHRRRPLACCLASFSPVAGTEEPRTFPTSGRPRAGTTSRATSASWGRDWACRTSAYEQSWRPKDGRTRTWPRRPELIPSPLNDGSISVALHGG